MASNAAAQIVREAVREGVTIGELTKLASGDPAFALRILSLVNSAAHARSHSVTDLNQAAALLGIRGLRNVALSLVVTDLVPMGAEGEQLLAQSFRRAIACRLIAQALKQSDVDSYFTAGLLLESGLLSRAKDNLEEVANLVSLPAEFRVRMEAASGHQPHPVLGAALAADYQLPAATIEAIALHHAKEMPEPPLARVCWLGERVAGIFESAIVEKNRQLVTADAVSVGLSESALDEILQQLPLLVSAAAEGFQRPLGEQAGLEQLREDAHLRLVQMNNQLEETVRTLERLVVEKQELTEQLKKANHELSEQAATDALTCLPNRRALEEALTRDLARALREKKPISFVVADVDHFKRFNDTYGHQQGDEVLKVVAKVLKNTARQGDVAARFGGEEFCVVLPGSDGKGARIAANRIRLAIENAVVDSASGPLSVTASFGVATIAPGNVESQQALFERADKALYVAKANGRNRVESAEDTQ